MVKYAANSAAKNISSEASQMMVPTATGSGRPSRPRSRDWGIGSALAGLVIEPEMACVKGHGVIIAATLLQVTLGATLFRDRWDPGHRAASG